MVDDQKASLDRFAALLSYFEEFKIIWTASSAKEALRKAEDEVPDVFLLDLEMPKRDGVQLCQDLRSRSIKAKILMLSISDRNDHLKRALHAGADGYLLKGERPEVLLRMIKDSLEGRMAFSAEMAQQSLAMMRSPMPEDLQTPEDYELSKRELQVLKHLVSGETYTDIAQSLIISPLTVRSHMENIYRKLQVQNKTQAINIALRNQWF